MKNVLIIFLLLFFVGESYSQGENDNWHFGFQAGLNFASNPPTTITNHFTDDRNGSASVSDAAGQLLFYTNGLGIINRNNIGMAGGLTGSTFCHQGALIVPFPEHPNLYFVFSNPGTFSGANNPIAYSIVDMNSNGGLGDITTLNVSLLDENSQPIITTSDALTSAINNNGNGYWILIQRNNNLYSYSITSAGFNNIPTVTALTFPSGFHNMRGNMKVSPDNSRIAINQNYQPGRIRIYNFNDTNGTVDTSSSIAIDNFWLPYGTEFSPDGETLYISTNAEGFHAMNLSTLQMRQVDSGSYCAIQRTKHGEIYLTKGLDSQVNIPYLSNIANPNDYANSVVNINSISLNGNCGNNLPQLIQMLPCQDNFPLTGNEISMVRTYQVSNTLSISGNYSVNSGMNITFFAGNSIAMAPNTHLRSGSAVLARIQACPTPASRISNAVSEETSTKLLRESKLLIYPNPTKDWVTVSLDSKIKTVNITSIIDGKIIYSNNNVSDFTHQLSSSGFAKGMYIITATNFQGKTFTEKIFKN